ncbi:hypothetical protein ACFOD4_08060 [Pseudoroseomonas globiformis]|uniref:Uncharacterized protein n=1 Tax=Teichococcus globiformis TaxID=2307229 RepID=A0ABV7G032_9PROT
MASMAPASPASGLVPDGRPSLLRPAGLQHGLAEDPACSRMAPLFRSVMPQRVAWQTVATPEADPEAAAEAEVPPEPAMHQALHLCAVEKLDPKRPFSGAARAVYRL